MNRYTRLTPSRYNPRSMQEMMLLPMMRRKQHDQSLAQASEMELFTQQAANVDKDTVDRVKGEFQGSIDKYVESLNRDGFNSETTQGMIDLSKNRRKLEEDYLNPAQANLQAMQAHRKQVMDSEDWGPDMAQKFAQQELGNFKGTFNEDGSKNTFSGRLMPKHVDVNKRIDEAIATVGNDIVQGGMTQYGIHNYNDLMRSDKIDRLDKNKILQTVGAQMQGDTEFLKSYKTESTLNGLDEFDSNGRLKIGSYNESGQFAPESQFGLMLYGKAAGAAFNKQTSTFTNIKDDIGLMNAKDKAKEELSGDAAWTLLPNDRMGLFNESFSRTVRNIGGGVAKSKYSHKGGNNYGGLAPTTDGTGDPFTFNDLDEEEQGNYLSIFKDLKATVPELADLDPQSKEGAKIVSDYLDRFSSATYSNALVTPNAVGNSGHDGALLLHKDNAKAGKLLTNHIKSGLIKVWDEQGNVKEFDPDEFDNGEIEYLGYVSPNNYLDAFREGTSEDVTMPHMFIGPDGENYYAQRMTSEYEDPNFMAGTFIKDTTFKGAKKPALPVSHEPDSRMREVGISDIITRYNPVHKTYSILMKDEQGRVLVDKTDIKTKAFNNAIYEIYK